MIHHRLPRWVWHQNEQSRGPPRLSLLFVAAFRGPYVSASSVDIFWGYFRHLTAPARRCYRCGRGTSSPGCRCTGLGGVVCGLARGGSAVGGGWVRAGRCGGLEVVERWWGAGAGEIELESELFCAAGRVVNNEPEYGLVVTELCKKTVSDDELNRKTRTNEAYRPLLGLGGSRSAPQSLQTSPSSLPCCCWALLCPFLPPRCSVPSSLGVVGGWLCLGSCSGASGGACSR